MTNPSKVKGDAFERGQRDHANAHGVPTERTKAGYARDAGDVHFYASPARAPLAIGQCKATPRSIDLPAFLRDAEEQRIEAHARWGVAIVKRRGVTDPGQQYVAMTYNTWLDLLRTIAVLCPELEEN